MANLPGLRPTSRSRSTRSKRHLTSIVSAVGNADPGSEVLTARPTQDLELFTRRRGDVRVARNELEAEAARRGWTVDIHHDSEDFCRLAAAPATRRRFRDPPGAARALIPSATISTSSSGAATALLHYGAPCCRAAVLVGPGTA